MQRLCAALASAMLVVAITGLPAAAAGTTTAAAASARTAPPGVIFPTAIDAKFSGEKPSLGRLHTCAAQYKIDKANKALGGLHWIQNGGGYYSICNARLKG
jgi:hypothetical protein